MPTAQKIEASNSKSAAKSRPPGKAKIIGALKTLLKEKEFSAITWADIAKTAGVNEGLIYKYFKDRRNLLYQVLKEFLEDYLQNLEIDLRGIEGALNKLRKLIWSTLNNYNSDRVFAKILLLEVRSFPDYYQSETYSIVRIYSDMILEIIKEGAEKGEIRKDVSQKHLRQILLGAIEHTCLPGIVFKREIPVELLTEQICKITFTGIQTQN